MRIKNFLIPFVLSLAVTFLLVFLAYRLADRPVLKPYEQPAAAEKVQNGGDASGEPTAPKPAPAPSVEAEKSGEQPPRERQEPASLSDEEARLLIASAARSDRNLVRTLMKEAGEKTSPLLDALVAEGRLTREDAQKLKEWAAGHASHAAAAQAGGKTDAPRVEMIGSATQEKGPVRRYRLTADNGSFVLVEMKRQPDGSWAVAGVSDRDADASADSLALADSFIRHVRRGDVVSARRLTTGRGVDPATLAGLCMLFDEGLYALRESEPIRGMFQNETNAGYLVYLRSKNDGKTAHIGLEMKRDGNGPWKIDAVSLDALLQEYERNGGLEGGQYFPIVRKPKGGDSIALFFGFNEDALTPRSLRQLAIVAELMKGTQRRLDISGHTDDVGSERFNYALSLRRAEAVRRALVRAGVDASRIRVKGFGKTQPLRRIGAGEDPEQVEEARGENRRAEIYLDFSE